MAVYKKWDIVMAEFGEEYDTCMMQGYRPAIVFSRDDYNTNAPIVFLVPLTRQLKNIDRDYHVFIDKADCEGYKSSGMALIEQMRPMDKIFIRRRVGMVTDRRLMDKLEEGILSFLGVNLS